MTDLGVVDPIRVPTSVQTYVRGMPRIAQVFVALALVDLVGRALGVVEPGIGFSTEYPTSFVSAFLPNFALILLPALVLIRRPDAETATPWILRGAVVVALVELLGSPTRAFVAGLDNSGENTLLFWVAALGLVLFALGWVALGRGLSKLNPVAPAAPIAGLANLAALLVASTIILWLIQTVLSPTNVADPPGAAGALTINHAAGLVGILAWAYLLRSVLRGLDDPSRSLTVTRLAAVGALLSATMTFFIALLGVIYANNIQFALTVGNDLSIWVYFVSDSIGISLIVLAIALGFADPLRPMPKDWDKAAAA